ncbi:hypothetical protein APASM_5619 [Actinosynnema pretiosum subsp. pretiosum]|nr:hypothetical protein APASM_5619 [Actinosynnema pretiosum subsp. pretiosum]
MAGSGGLEPRGRLEARRAVVSGGLEPRGRLEARRAVVRGG